MTATVPTADDHAQLADRVTAVEAGVEALRNAAPAPTFVLRPEDFGATPGADCTAAFQHLFAAVDGQLLKADAGGGVPVARVTVQLGEGPYLVSGPILGEASGRAQALTIQGIGKRASEIVTSAKGPLINNWDRWMGVRLRDCSFRSTNPGAGFMYCYSTGAVQDIVCDNVEWRGTWDYGFGLDGPETSNCNSEMGWNNCHINGSYGRAFLLSGMTPKIAQQDQFLNYWFNDCKVEYDWGDFLRFDKGGFIKVSGGSYIIKSQRPDGGLSRFFYLPTTGHYDSVQKLAVRDVRFELRNAASRVIESHWNGHVVFDGCSDTALGFQAHSPGLVAHDYTNPGVVRYTGCDLVGKHAYHATSTLSRQVTVYEGCTRKNNRTAATFLIRDGAGAAKLRIVHRDDGDGIA